MTGLTHPKRLRRQCPEEAVTVAAAAVGVLLVAGERREKRERLCSGARGRGRTRRRRGGC